MCSRIFSPSKFESTFNLLQQFLLKIKRGGCILKADFQYSLSSEEVNLDYFAECLAELIKHLQNQLEILQSDEDKHGCPVQRSQEHLDVKTPVPAEMNIPTASLYLPNDECVEDLHSTQQKMCHSNGIVQGNSPENSSILQSSQSSSSSQKVPRSSVCPPTTLLNIPPVVIQKSSHCNNIDENCTSKFSTGVASRFNGAISSSENSTHTPNTLGSFHQTRQPSCLFSPSNQHMSIEPKDKALHLDAVNKAHKDATNVLQVKVLLPATDIAFSATSSLDCPARTALLDDAVCRVGSSPQSLQPPLVSCANLSSTSTLRASLDDSQSLKLKDSSRNAQKLSSFIRQTDAHCSDSPAESSISSVLHSSSFSLNFEVPHPTPVTNNSSINVENPSNSVFDSVVPAPEPSTTDPCKEYNSDLYSEESLGSLPFLCCKICTNVYLLYESFTRHACKSLEVSNQSAVEENLIQKKSKLEELKKFTCSTCGVELRSVGRMVHHLARCRPGPYSCGECATQFHLRPALHLHLNTQHRRTSCHVCDECGLKFQRRTSLERHVIRRHEDASAGPFKCDACPKKFIRRIYLTNHKLRMHELPKPFTCEVCGSGLLSAASLAVHRRCMHGPTDQLHTCSHCGKCFARKEKLVLHVRRHTGERPYVCEVCNRGFVSKSKLEEHSARQHLPLQARRRHSCVLCPKTYANRADLRKHASRVHDDAGKRAGRGATCDNSGSTGPSGSLAAEDIHPAGSDAIP